MLKPLSWTGELGSGSNLLFAEPTAGLLLNLAANPFSLGLVCKDNLNFSDAKSK